MLQHPKSWGLSLEAKRPVVLQTPKKRVQKNAPRNPARFSLGFLRQTVYGVIFNAL